MKVRALQLLANSYLPDDVKSDNLEFSDKGLNRVLYNIALKHGSKEFVRVNKALSDLGLQASFLNGETMTLNDLKPVIDRQPIYDSMDLEISQLNKKAPDFKQKRNMIFQKYNDIIQKKTAEQALKNRNNIAMAVLSGARGKPDQLKAMISTPGTYSDYKGEPVPIFSRESFAEGVRPVTFLAGSYGTRASVSLIKRGTAKGGDLAKQFALAVADLVIRKHDCGTHNGIKLEIGDKSCIGRVLANDAGPYKEGDFITRQMVHDLEKKGIKHIVARSPLTCSVENGLCAKCVGKYIDGGKLPVVGDHIGAVSSSTQMEPVCLVKDTLVRMADGSEKKIQDIAPGDIVLGSDINGNCIPTKVVNVFHNGPRDCYETIFNLSKGSKNITNTAVLRSTLQHKVLSYCGTQRGADIQPVIRPIGELPKGTKYNLCGLFIAGWEDLGGEDEPMAMLLGMLVGDGSYTGSACGSASVAVRLSCYDNLQAEELSLNIADLGLALRCYSTPNEYRIIDEKIHESEFWVKTEQCGIKDSNKIRNRVRAKLILEEMWGLNCYTKSLPKSIWKWNKKSVCEFIGGLIATDGFISTDNTGKLMSVGYSSNNINLLKQIKLLLQTRLGVYAGKITKGQKKKTDGTLYNPTYALTIGEIGNLQRLHEQVHIPGRKQALFDTSIKLRTPPKTRRGLYKVIDQIHIGILDTWDILVDNETHLFALANGLIVSNTQMSLSSKHSGGMTQGKKSYSGLETIIQFTQSPEKFKDHAAVATVDGKVEAILDAPQGGKYITVAGIRHYVPSGHDPEAEIGQTVELGDFLSEGLGDPEDVVKYKGIGAGRLYYANRLNKILEDSGAGSDKRLTEVLSRGAIRHVRVTSPEGMGDYLPDDIVDYNVLLRSYRMPETAKPMNVKSAVGKYLQQPILHYTIGTRITPSVMEDLLSVGYDNVYADDEKPDFEPEMIRLRGASHTSPDWMASQGTSYLSKQLAESVMRGDDTNVKINSDWRPRMAYGKDFANNVRQTGIF